MKVGADCNAAHESTFFVHPFHRWNQTFGFRSAQKKIIGKILQFRPQCIFK